FNGGRTSQAFGKNVSRLTANLNGGSDHLVLHDLSLLTFKGAGSLSADMGAGDDSIELNHVFVGIGEKSIDLGNGNDTVSLGTQTYLGSGLKIDGGKGIDRYVDLGTAGFPRMSSVEEAGFDLSGWAGQFVFDPADPS